MSVAELVVTLVAAVVSAVGTEGVMKVSTEPHTVPQLLDKGAKGAWSPLRALRFLVVLAVSAVGADGVMNVWTDPHEVPIEFWAIAQ